MEWKLCPSISTSSKHDFKSLTLRVLQDQKIVNLSKLILFIIQSSSFLAYTWNPPCERVFTTEPFHAWWSTVPLIAYDDSIVRLAAPGSPMIVASPACAFTWRTWYQTGLKLNTRVFAATYHAWASQECRLQNSPYFCVFKYARAVKQTVWNEADALPISLLILRKKTGCFAVYKNVDRFWKTFHMTSQRPCWCPKLVLWELNSFHMQTLSFVAINLHRRWPREWLHLSLANTYKHKKQSVHKIMMKNFK